MAASYGHPGEMHAWGHTSLQKDFLAHMLGTHGELIGNGEECGPDGR